ncbi:quinone oxidoreductase [Bradyrhizobium lablabi]|uniref:Quinone oxidoreductase n=1 Tax=Bradyrhizobium lablabi TaxID=722472 RepID=A0A0R3MQ40_9BRAD|nr:quinone oxidoreductase [Bradyrhizobium lablabi]KRR22199.1 quinone oxidoreductase [Bradyrhizobium lablabi]
MTSAIRIESTGGPDVLRLEQVEQEAPKSGQAWIEHDAIGVNYLDVTQRNGAVPIPLPSGLGLEGAGRVTAIGPDVENVAVGDRVGYALGPLGSYAIGRLYPANRLVKLPDAITSEDAAAVIFKGITAQYLIKSTFQVKSGTTVLLYGAAGALGQILAPWAKHLGAFVIGVVSKESSAPRAKAAGCDAVVIWSEDLPAEIRRLTGGRKADVVYDGVGRTTFAASLDSLRPRGTMVSFGASTGAPPPVEVGTLNAKGSLFLTRPGLAAHATDIHEYRERVLDVFDAVERGIIKPSVWKTYALSDAAGAHEALERGRSAGAIVLRP